MKTLIIKQNIKQRKFEENFIEIQSKIQYAIKKQYEMVIFPSNCITGVFVGDLIKDNKIKEDILSYNEKIKKLAKEIYVVWGNLYEKSQSILIAKDNEFYVINKKNRNQRFFDESHFYEEGENQRTLLLNNEKITIGFDVISDEFAISFGNDEIGKEKIIPQNGIYINHFGCENYNKNVIVFDGMVQVNCNGTTVLRHDKLESSIIDAEEKIDRNHTLLDTIIFALQEFDNQVFQKRFNWIIGLSGGLDSTISAALLCLAFEKNRVIGYNMATKYNTNSTKNIAKKLAEKLGIQYREGNITKLVEATSGVLSDYGYEEYSDLTMQNIQARIRGHLLSSFASIENGVIVNNGNKVETALGYATMYGDMIGAISPLADLTKVSLFELAKEINKVMNDEIIPSDLLPQEDMTWIQKPSAELQSNQFDPMKWFYHDYIVEHLNKSFTINEFLEMYLNQTLPQEVEKWIEYHGLDDSQKFVDDIKWVVNTMNRNKYKLLQAPPILSLSSSTFGSDVNVIQGEQENKEFNRLISEILNKN